MTRDETVALFLECEAKRAQALATALANGWPKINAHEIGHEIAKQHWNSWAEGLLTKRKQLESSNRWATEESNGNLVPKNAETRAWMAEAEADFSNCLFLLPSSEANKQRPEEVKERSTVKGPAKEVAIKGLYMDMTDFVFPGDTSFESATFSDGGVFCGAIFLGNASFGGATFCGFASFSRATFSRVTRFHEGKFTAPAWFDNAMFLGGVLFTLNGSPYALFEDMAYFDSAKFEDLARFDGVAFLGGAVFDNVTFLGEAWFNKATFSFNAVFSNATFRGLTRFDGRTFSGNANFLNATFSGDTRFERTIFRGSTLFRSATFSKSTSFRGAELGCKEKNTDGDFTAIKVERAFDLTGANFSKVPSFCQADFKQAPDLDGVRFPTPDAEPFVSGDPDLIPKYRAIRRMAIQGADYDREQRAFKGELRSRRWTTDRWWHPSLSLGILYDGIADCGRSIIQPFAVWAATIIAFATFYWSRAIAGAEIRCAEHDGPFVQALYLSVKNALVLFAGTRDARVNQAYVCLYNGSAEHPHIPASVTFVETLLQFPISAVLIFLFLLAVKNRFKIK